MAPSVNAGEGETYVPGRSATLARELIAKAESVGVDPKLVRATSFGYIVPTEVAEAEAVVDDVEAPADTDSDAGDVPDHKDETIAGSAPVNELPGTGPEKLDATPGTPGDNSDLYDPSKFKAEEVNAYLETATPEERDRVLAAEAEGKNRVSILPPKTEGN